MISVTLGPDGDGRLVPAYSERRPDETLHEFLLRSRQEMALHIRVLEATSDAQTQLFASERTRSRRTMISLALSGAGFAAATYLLLAHNGLAGNGPAPFLAAMIGGCALAGAAAPLGIASMASRIPSWRLASEDLLRRLLGRPRRAAEPCATIHPLVRGGDLQAEVIAPEEISEAENAACDLDRDPVVIELIEDFTIDRLETRTFFWGLGLPVFQAMVIATLFCAVRVMFGWPLAALMADMLLVLVICLIGFFFLLIFSNLASGSLARLMLWWRRR
ncbi:hypothetical protein VHN57_10260 [Sphingobium sp. WW5]|uniref:hypothetical protein n=1 Tax=unclassified Sphingobium TaxID=2611147 RepID=UPI00065C6C55